MSADPIDQACEREQEDTEKAVEAARKGAALFDPGKPGYCQECGTFYSRLVRRLCCRCRDSLNK